MGKRDYRKGALTYEFVPIPKAVLTMPEYKALPSNAKVLMLDLAAQYTGKNNGRLCPAWQPMARAGWVSKSTLQRARDALLAAPFVVHTRKGHPPRTVDWLAFTWWKLDYDRSMDAWIDPRTFPFLNFIRLAPPPRAVRAAAQEAVPAAAASTPAEKHVLSPPFEGVRTRKVVLLPLEMREQGAFQ